MRTIESQLETEEQGKNELILALILDKKYKGIKSQLLRYKTKIGL